MYASSPISCLDFHNEHFFPAFSNYFLFFGFMIICCHSDDVYHKFSIFSSALMCFKLVPGKFNHCLFGKVKNSNEPPVAILYDVIVCTPKLLPLLFVQQFFLFGEWYKTEEAECDVIRHSQWLQRLWWNTIGSLASNLTLDKGCITNF